MALYIGSTKVSPTITVQGSAPIDWQPNPDWWDIETILTNDTEDYAGKAIILYSNSDDFTTFTISSPVVAVATSDGAFYTSTTTHTWDRTKDKVVTSDSSDTTPKYATRYVILYFNSADVDYSALTNFRNGSLYAVFKCNLTKYSADYISNNSFFYNNRTIQSFKFLTGYNFSFGGVFGYFCRNCYSLRKLPDNLDTSNVTVFEYFCANCYALGKLPDNLDTSSGTSFSYFCYYCYSLVQLPDNLDTSSGTYFSSFCQSCYSLVKANIKLSARSNVTTITGWSFIDIQSLRYIANNAPTVSGKTLTIGSINITRAGGTSGTIISTLTNKGWTVN